MTNGKTSILGRFFGQNDEPEDWLNIEEEVSAELARGASNLRATVFGNAEAARFRAQELETVAGSLAAWQSNSPVYPEYSANGGFVHHGYKANAPFFASILKIYEAFSMGRLKVVDRDDAEVKGHPLVKALSAPSDFMGLRARTKAFLNDAYCYGNALWELVPGRRRGEPVQAYRIPPWCVAIEPGDPANGEPWVLNYWVNVGGMWYPIESKWVVHFKFSDPSPNHYARYWGIPPVLSAARELGIDAELVDQMKVMVQNRAPLTILETTTPGGVAGIMPDKDAIQETQRLWSRYAGGRHPGVPILPSHVKAKAVGMNLRDLDLTQAASLPADRISMIHGVPKSVLGGSGTGTDPTRANADSHYRLFLETTITSLQHDVADVLTAKALPLFRGSEDLRVVYDQSSIPALRRSRIEDIKAVTEAFKQGLLSRRKAQEIADAERHGQDVFYRPTTVSTVVPADETREDIPRDEDI